MQILNEKMAPWQKKDTRWLKGVLAKGHYKFVAFQDNDHNHLTAIFTVKAHSAIAQALQRKKKLQDEDFLGAGNGWAKGQKIEYRSGTCCDRYGRDCPSDGKLAKKILEEIRTAVLELLAENINP